MTTPTIDRNSHSTVLFSAANDILCDMTALTKAATILHEHREELDVCAAVSTLHTLIGILHTVREQFVDAAMYAQRCERDKTWRPGDDGDVRVSDGPL
jgi:hypothetical protein